MLTNSDTVKTTFIRGEPELCRAFLFETAVYWANEGKIVYYFTSKPYDCFPPKFHDRKEPSVAALKFIRFIYATSFEMFAGKLVRLPTFQRLPSLILVEDFDHFTRSTPGRSVEFTASRCCAVLANTASTCSRLAGHGVQVCASAYAEKNSGRQDAVYGVYFDKFWSISSRSGDDGVDVVWLKQKGGVSMEFSWLDDPVLVLKRIYGTEEDKKVWLGTC